MEGTRKRGRPRKGWRGEVEKELNIMGIKNGQAIAKHHREWRKNVLEANVSPLQRRKGRAKSLELRKNKKKRYKTTLKGWIYGYEKMVTTVQSDRINKLLYRATRNTLKIEAADWHETPVHFYLLETATW
jgi:hypothetical protein